MLGIKVEGLNKILSGLTNEQRRAIFFKITHDGPISLSGTGLKQLVERSDRVTLVVPRDDSLERLSGKIEQFGTAEPSDAGFIPNQDIARIEDIERGDPKDRLSDELFENYDELIKTKQPSIICEIEILSLLQGVRQQEEEIAETLAALNLAFASGVHGTLFEHEARGPICRAVIRCTGAMFKQLVEDEQWQWRIRWFEPKPKFETFHTVWHNFRFDRLKQISPPDESAPTVCVIDSGVSSGNPFLTPVTREDLLRSFLEQKPDNPGDEVGHGSGVASLVSYYALNLAEDAENAPKAWIASARILDETNQIEEGRLLSRILEDVVETFVPLGVRIFNLSVGDLGKKWNQVSKRTQPRTSWVARTLDRLSREHDIVFVTSTGNLLETTILDYLNEGNQYPSYLCDEEARILDPGQAGLALTVGSIAAPSAIVTNSPDTAIAQPFEPSPFSRSGPGIKRETKPELTDIGGNLVSDIEQNAVRSNPGTSVVMASNQLTPAAARNYGTSFAAPRVAHKLAVVMQDLQELGLDDVSAPLLKAFLVNSSTYRSDPWEFEKRLDTEQKKRSLDLLGYGIADAALATNCDDYSILLFYQGTIEPDQVAFFDVPVPVTLSQSNDKKRITVTVAHYPEVQKWGLESYFSVDLKWRFFRGDVDRDSIVEAMSHSTEDSGESDDEVALPSEVKFEHKVTRRSRGAVQHDWCEWTQHRESFSDNHYTLAVACHKRWSRRIDPTPLAIVVRIEDLGGQVPIYNEIVNQIDVMVDTMN